jgi:hypothetical protein
MRSREGSDTFLFEFEKARETCYNIVEKREV